MAWLVKFMGAAVCVMLCWPLPYHLHTFNMSLPACLTLQTPLHPHTCAYLHSPPNNTNTHTCLLSLAIQQHTHTNDTQAYYDKSKVTPEAVDAYRLPQLVRGWESGGWVNHTCGLGDGML